MKMNMNRFSFITTNISAETLHLTPIPCLLWWEYTDGYFASFQHIIIRNNISSDFILRGLSFPKLPQSSWNWSPFLPQNLWLSFTQFDYCLYFPSLVNLKSLREGDFEEKIPEQLWQDSAYTPRHSVLKVPNSFGMMMIHFGDV